MSERDPLRPNGVQVESTDTGQVVLRFDHAEIPEIALDRESGKRLGSHLASFCGRLQHGGSDE